MICAGLNANLDGQKRWYFYERLRGATVHYLAVGPSVRKGESHQ